MLVMLTLLLLSSYATAVLARAALIIWQVRRAAEGKKLWPISFTTEQVATPRGDTPILALGADAWQNGAAWANTPAPPAKRGGFWVTSRGIAVGRTEWRLVGWRPTRRVEGRERRDRGWLFITDRHVGWRGKGERFDIPLRDIAHLEVRRPLIEIRLHSRPNAPLLVRVPQAVAVAQLVALLSAKAMGYTVQVAPALRSS